MPKDHGARPLAKGQVADVKQCDVANAASGVQEQREDCSCPGSKFNLSQQFTDNGSFEPFGGELLPTRFFDPCE